ncbi:MAG: hypothetical protein RL885_05635 [Planctomycetota bacterium]
MIRSMPLLVALLLIAPAQGQEPQSEGTRGAFHWEPRVDRLADLYFEVRAHAAQEPTELEPAALAHAVSVVREQGAKISHPLLWGPLDAEIEGVSSARELLERFEALPESRPMLGGGELRLREIGVAIGNALLEWEPIHAVEVWPARRTSIAAKKSEVEARWKEKSPAVWKFVLDAFGMEDPGGSAPVYLVSVAPPPGGVTYYRRAGGGGMCIVGLEGAEGTQLDETVLHEALHALEAQAGRDAESAPNALRSKMMESGASPRDPKVRNRPHLLLFVQAGESVKRFIDPEHRHYGEVSGAYERFGKDADLVRREWVRYLDGEQTREKAIAKIAEG